MKHLVIGPMARIDKNSLPSRYIDITKILVLNCVVRFRADFGRTQI